MSERRTFEFTARALKGLPIPPKPKQLDYFDTKVQGLGVRVSYGGKKTFFLMYSNSAGKRQRLSLGEHGYLEDGKLSLAVARKRARAKAGEVAKDKDPVAEARAQRSAPTVRQLTADYIADRRKAGKKSVNAIEHTIAREILPIFGDVRARDVTEEDVEHLLDDITERPAPVMSNRVREIVSAVWHFGRRGSKRRRLYGLQGNVAEGITPNEQVPRDRYLSLKEIAAYWRALDQERPGPVAALRLCLLTAQRQANVLGMCIDQLSLDDRLWIIPARETKTGKPYKVPLSTAAVGIIQARIADVEEAERLRARRARRPAGPVTWIFPKRDRDEPATRMYFAQTHRTACQRAGIEDYTIHDHRRTFGWHCDAMGVSRLVWDGIAGHITSSMAELYSGHDFAEWRLACMEQWADRIASALGDNVVSLDRSRDKIS